MKKYLAPIIAAILLMPSLASAQFNVNQGGTGKTLFPANTIITSDGSTFQRLQGTSSNPLWLTYVNATSTTATSSLPQLTATDLSLTHALPGTSGGTGFGTIGVGDLLTGTAGNMYLKLADIATGNVLISGGVATAPSYGKVGLTTHVSGILPILNGGTNQSAFVTNTIVGFNGTSLTATGTPSLTSGYFIATSTSATTTLQGTVLASAGGTAGVGTSTPGNAATLGVNGPIFVGGAAATSTFAGGINILTGCHAINNVCVGGGSAAAATTFVSTTSAQAMSTSTIDLTTISSTAKGYDFFFHASSTSGATANFNLCFNSCTATDLYDLANVSLRVAVAIEGETFTSTHGVWLTRTSGTGYAGGELVIRVHVTNDGSMYHYGTFETKYENGINVAVTGQFVWKQTAPITSATFTTGTTATWGSQVYISAKAL